MRLSRVLSNLVVLCCAGIVSLLIVELGLRALGIHYPSFYKVDVRRGYGLRPNAFGPYAREGQSWVEINAAGFRGTLPSPTPAKNILRIAVLGDSFTESLQVDLGQTWIQGLQRRLNSGNSCPLLGGGRKAELLNFGVGGYGTGQALLTWRHQALLFAPEIVILAVYPGNDFTDNEPGPRNDRPGFDLRPDGTIDQDNSFLKSAGFRWRTSIAGRFVDGLVTHSRFFQLGNEAKNRFVAFSRQTSGSANSFSAPSHAPEASPEAWALTEALVSQLDQEVSAVGGRLLVISTSSPDQVWPDMQGRPAEPFLQERRFASLLSGLGVPYLPLGPSLQEAVDQDPGLLLHGFPDGQPGRGHWNVSGHNLAERQLAPWLCKQ
jgi:hypothetical protein